MSKISDKDYLQAAIDEAIKDTTFIDMMSIVGKEITEQAALLSIMQANLEKSLEAFPEFKEKMEELRARRIVFKGKLSNIEKSGIIT